MNREIDEHRKGTQSVNLGADYTDEQIEWLKAVEAYKRTKQKPCPSWPEILAIAKSLGYQKIAEATDLPKIKVTYGGRRPCNRDNP